MDCLSSKAVRGILRTSRPLDNVKEVSTGIEHPERDPGKLAWLGGIIGEPWCTEIAAAGDRADVPPRFAKVSHDVHILCAHSTEEVSASTERPERDLGVMAGFGDIAGGLWCSGIAAGGDGAGIIPRVAKIHLLWAA